MARLVVLAFAAPHALANLVEPGIFEVPGAEPCEGAPQDLYANCQASSCRNQVTGADDDERLSWQTGLVQETECMQNGEPIQDCDYCLLTSENSRTCAKWQNHAVGNPQGVMWILILAYILGAVMAFGIGGNDSANALATSVGSGAISLKNACYMGAVGELMGATFLGAGVSGTIQRGVADMEDTECWACGFCNSKMGDYQFGMMAALCGSSFFLLMVTFFSLPVSTTHAVVGGVVGMTAAAVGWSCLNFSMIDGLGRIAAGWVVSPLVAGLVGSACYVIFHKFIFDTANPKERALTSVPIMYSLTCGTMTILIVEKASFFKRYHDLWYGTWPFVVTAAFAVAAFALSYAFILPGLKKEVEDAEAEFDADSKREPWKALSQMSAAPMNMGSLLSVRKSGMQGGGIEIGTPMHKEGMEGGNVDAEAVAEEGLKLGAPCTPTRDQAIAKTVFKQLLVLNAFLKCFAHGANDTSNATGPVGAIHMAYEGGIHACGARETAWYIMMIAGIFVGLGVIFMGYRVIEAVGSELASDIDFHIGFIIEFASSAAVVVATYMELPVSTTHCQIGAIVFVGATAYGKDSVSWSMFGKIAVTWLATLPAAGGVGYLITWFRTGLR